MKRYDTSLQMLVISCLGALLLCAGCKNNINTMLKDYNSHFIPTEDNIVYPSPDDADFDPSQMLSEEYTISDRETINICAPGNCAAYKWSIRNPFITEVKNPNGTVTKYPDGKPVDFHCELGSDSQRFVLFVPKSKLELGVYILELTVKDYNSNSYSDTCKLIIYQHID